MKTSFQMKLSLSDINQHGFEFYLFLRSMGIYLPLKRVHLLSISLYEFEGYFFPKLKSRMEKGMSAFKLQPHHCIVLL